jgi:hypothetical protein
MEMQDGMGLGPKENRSLCVCCDPDCCGGSCCGSDSGRSEAGNRREALRPDQAALKDAVANLVAVVFGRAQTAACCAPASGARSCC